MVYYRHTRMRMRVSKWAHKSAQSNTKEIDDWFSSSYVFDYLHKFLFYLCKWYIICANLIICARFVQCRAEVVQILLFLCNAEIPLFKGVSRVLCFLVLCCAQISSRTRAKSQTHNHKKSPDRFTAAGTWHKKQTTKHLMVISLIRIFLVLLSSV